MGQFFGKSKTLKYFVTFLNGANSGTMLGNGEMLHGLLPLKCFPMAQRHLQNISRAFPLKYMLRFCELLFLRMENVLLGLH